MQFPLYVKLTVFVFQLLFNLSQSKLKISQNRLQRFKAGPEAIKDNDYLKITHNPSDASADNDNYKSKINQISFVTGTNYKEVNITYSTSGELQANETRDTNDIENDNNDSFNSIEIVTAKQQHFGRKGGKENKIQHSATGVLENNADSIWRHMSQKNIVRGKKDEDENIATSNGRISQTSLVRSEKYNGKNIALSSAGVLKDKGASAKRHIAQITLVRAEKYNEKNNLKDKDNGIKRRISQTTLIRGENDKVRHIAPSSAGVLKVKSAQRQINQTILVRGEKDEEKNIALSKAEVLRENDNSTNQQLSKQKLTRGKKEKEKNNVASAAGIQKDKDGSTKRQISQSTLVRGEKGEEKNTASLNKGKKEAPIAAGFLGDKDPEIDYYEHEYEYDDKLKQWMQQK